MRILIMLTTVLAAAALGSASGAAATVAAASDVPPCRPAPETTVWTWPLTDGATPASPTAPTTLSTPATASAATPATTPATTPTATPTTAPSILRPFEPPVERWDAGHRGVDLAGFAGAAVLAAGKGTVLFAGRVVDQDVVVVGHGMLRTTYEPVFPSVAVGAQVVAGQRVGTLEVGHCAATACLHWGLLSGHAHATVYYDPLLLLGCGAVRLEPDDG